MNKEDNEKITFLKKEFRGSRFRCLQLTHQPDENVRSFLNSLVSPYATVRNEDTWAPKGFLRSNETLLLKPNEFLDSSESETLFHWWLKHSGTDPNWDLVATFQAGGHDRGLILLEAKGHEAEFEDTSCESGSSGSEKGKENRARIEQALTESTTELNELMKQISPTPAQFDLSATSYYQLCNRVAFSWKLASMGIPIVLVYLGFLDADEMGKSSGVVLRTAKQWEKCVKDKSRAHVPNEVWGNTFDVNGTPLTFLIRSTRVSTVSEVL